QRQKRRVALIHVEYSGLQPHGLEGPHAADAQHNLLADTCVDIAAVKGVRDIAVLRENVFRDIGVQKIQRDSPNADLPDLDEYITRRQFDRDLEVLVVDGFDGDQRQSVKIVNRIPLLLPAVRIEKLPEISLLVQKADPDQREILV